MFFVLRYFTLFTLTVFLIFNNVFGGDTSGFEIRSTGGAGPSSATSTDNVTPIPYYNKITGQLAGYIVSSNDPYLNTPNSLYNTVGLFSGPSIGPIPIALPYYDGVTGHLAGYIIPNFGPYNAEVPSLPSRPSTGHFNPQPNPKDAENFEYSLDKAKRACLANIMETFHQIQNDIDKVRYAFTDLKVDSILQHSPAHGYYQLLSGYINTKRILDPVLYCETLSAKNKKECKEKLSIFGVTTNQAVGYAFFHYTTNDLPNQHQKEYIEHICDNVSLIPNIPDPKLFCRSIYNYNNVTRWNP